MGGCSCRWRSRCRSSPASRRPRFIDGLLGALWIALRLFQGYPRRRRAFAAKVVTGGAVGLLLATQLLVAVYAYSPYANIGLHGQAVDDALSRAAGPLLVVPYSFGPIDAFVPYNPTGTIANVWGGGFVTTSLLFLSLVGLAGARHRGVRIAMAASATFALMRTFGVGIAYEMTRVIPYLDRTLFSSYSAPSWELAILVLAMLGLDDLMDRRINTLWVAGAALVSLALTGLAVHIARSYLGDIRTAPGHELASEPQRRMGIPRHHPRLRRRGRRPSFMAWGRTVAVCRDVSGCGGNVRRTRALQPSAVARSTPG